MRELTEREVELVAGGGTAQPGTKTGATGTVKTIDLGVDVAVAYAVVAITQAIIRR